MAPVQRPNLLCTVGTSLLGNLDRKFQRDDNKATDDPLLQRYAAGDWAAVGKCLAAMPPSDPLCGAEINSIASMVEKGYIPQDAGLFFFHSATPEGRHVATALRAFYLLRGHVLVETVEVTDLQDHDPKRFRTHGLRNLARHVCKVIHDHGPEYCAINATGGYKAQIAIGVLLGQALGVPVYYKHERFSEIIAFPPLPIALDYEVWMRASGLLHLLEQDGGPVPAAEFAVEWDERYDALVERESVDGMEYVALSATGQIFHETFRQRFRSDRDQVLPPPALPGQKLKPVIKNDEGHLNKHRDELERFMMRIIDEIPQVTCCTTRYYNPDLPQRTRFIETRGEIEGIYSNGTYCVKMRIDSTAQTTGQRTAVVAALNEWFHKSKGG